MGIINNITELVGKTPLVKLNRIFKDFEPITITAKLEQFNPCNSVKDRAALGMIVDAENSGRLRSGGTIIEATSGNTGIAMGCIAAIRNYRCIVVMPENTNRERQWMLSMFGVETIFTPSHLGMQGAVDEAEKLSTEIKGAVMLKQFDNEANAAVHEQTTAEEIWEDTEGKVDLFIAGVGSGGTVTGVARGLKKRKKSIKIVAVEPASSPVLSGGCCGQHMIMGLGAGFVPSIYDANLIDEIVQVGDEEAVIWAKRLVREEGIFAGISSGAALCGASKYLERTKSANRLAVVLCPDGGERYLSVPLLFGKV